MNRPAARILLFATVVIAGGCAHQPKPTTRPSIATTQPSYWLQQPASASVSAGDFDRLWNAAEDSARRYGFQIDRKDYRGGVLTTLPLTSKQWFEFWRNDVQTSEDLADSSLATYRRTLRFEFAKTPDGKFQASPAVLIERYAMAENPITSSVYLRNAFRGRRGKEPIGTAESDRGIRLPRRYWYATGRDTVLERDIAKTLEKRVNKG